jgi:hypothetical protein
MRKNGSGNVTISYTVQKELIDLAAFGEKSDLPSIPLTKEDFESGIKKNGGLRLASYSHKADEKNYIYTVKIDFDSPAALESYFNSAVSSAEYSRPPAENSRLTLYFWRSIAASSGDSAKMKTLLDQAFEGYNFDFAIGFPADYTARYINADGEELEGPPSGVPERAGSNYRLNIPVSALFIPGKSAAVEFVWRP